MKVLLTSVMVQDQEKALRFYTGVLGFVKTKDVSMGEYRWLTVAGSDDPGGVEILLEPVAFPPARTYQQELFKAGIPAAVFHVRDIEKEYQRLTEAGVAFSVKPTPAGPTKRAVFNDTCGNNIQILQIV
ncbi:MAG TPA: VOC family protein [Bacteroidota bacterium]|nr:VOC family protein [Bacteroidota bacterium]